MVENATNIEELLEKMKDENKWRRASAVGSLGSFQDVHVVKSLIEVLGDYDSDVRWVAVRALTKIGKLAVEPLIQALPDKEDYWVRTNAAEALSILGDIRAIEPLEQLLQNEKREWVRDPIEKALEQLKQEH